LYAFHIRLKELSSSRYTLGAYLLANIREMGKIFKKDEKAFKKMNIRKTPNQLPPPPSGNANNKIDGISLPKMPKKDKAAFNPPKRQEPTALGGKRKKS
jgi:hypothetical protein